MKSDVKYTQLAGNEDTRNKKKTREEARADEIRETREIVEEAAWKVAVED